MSRMVCEKLKSLSLLSNDEQTKVACIICKKDDYDNIVSVGYNRTIKSSNKFPKTRPEKYPFMIHAEVDALISCRYQKEELDDCVLFCTHMPCDDCLKYIADFGIKEIFYFTDYPCDKRTQEEIVEVLGIRLEKVSAV